MRRQLQPGEAVKVHRVELRVCEPIARHDNSRHVNEPSHVYDLLGPELRSLTVEQFWVLHLGVRKQVLHAQRISEGTLTSSLVHPREVFRAAVQVGSPAIIVAHNHPSGDPEPSREDRELTKRLIESGKLLGIPVLDHVIIAGSSYRSLRQSTTLFN